MSASKRARACDACHAIKIRCELGSGSGLPPCERCARLGKDCVITPPKRQKDRVAELEAQVQALTRLLASQNIEVPTDSPGDSSPSTDQPDLTTPTTASSASTKKRRLAETSPDHQSEDIDNGSTARKALCIADLDGVVAYPRQAQLLHKYLTAIPFNLKPVVADSHDNLRKHPVLLSTLLFAVAHGELSLDDQEALSILVLEGLTTAVIVNGQKSIELLQALQIVGLWYRTPRQHSDMSMHTILAHIVSMSRSLGLAEFSPFTVNNPPESGTALECLDAWRTWSGCYLVCASAALGWRQQSGIVWGKHEESTNFMLEYNGGASDRALGHCVRGIRLCDQVASNLGTYDNSVVIDVSDPSIQRKLQYSASLVTDWKLQRSLATTIPLAGLWEHTAMLVAHEAVLYTATNKHSFTAPYLAERLSVADLPAPIVTQQHISSLEVLREAGHAVIELFAGLQSEYLLNIPAILFTVKALYAQWILIKLYIALTAPGNTYGFYMDASSVQIHRYLQYLIDLASRVAKIDAKCILARILGSASRLKEWLAIYESTYLAPTRGSVDSVGAADISAGLPQTTSFGWTDFNLDELEAFGFENLFNEDFNTLLPGTAFFVNQPAQYG